MSLLHAKRELSDKQLRRLTTVDYEREMALIAVREGTEDTVAVARLVADKDEHEAEFAVIVQPDMKGRGLGGELLRRLFAWGRSRGVLVVHGEVLADNTPMLAFVRRLGFRLHRMEGADDVVAVRLMLQAT